MASSIALPRSRAVSSDHAQRVYCTLYMATLNGVIAGNNNCGSETAAFIGFASTICQPALTKAGKSMAPTARRVKQRFDGILHARR